MVQNTLCLKVYTSIYIVIKHLEKRHRLAVIKKMFFLFFYCHNLLLFGKVLGCFSHFKVVCNMGTTQIHVENKFSQKI